MKYPLAPSTYSFNAAAGTIAFSGTVPADISNIMHVANITRGVIYFQPQAGAAFSGTYSSPTLTLAASTAGHANGDALLVIYDDGASVNTITASAGTPLVTFTRPADTTAYGATDVIGSASSANHQATSAGRSGSLIQVMSASVLINATSVPSGLTTARLHIWSAQPTVIADNAVFSAAAGDRSLYCGFIDLAAVQAIGGGFCWTQGDYVGRPIRLTGTSFWFNLALTGAAGFTPASGTEFRVRFHVAEVGP